MADIFEVNCFVDKFVNLWQAGRNAGLQLDSHAGQASATLQRDLGQPVPEFLLLNMFLQLQGTVIVSKELIPEMLRKLEM